MSHYRSPVASMRRELATLESRLAALRAPTTLDERSIEAEARTLRSTLDDLERQIAARSKDLGLRALTPRELQINVRDRRLSLASLLLGLVVTTLELVEVARREEVSIGWTITAVVLLLFGVLGLFFGRLDRRNRESGKVAPDDFGGDA